MTAKRAHYSAARTGSAVVGCLTAFDDGFLGLAGDLARGLAGDLARGLAAARRGRDSSLSSCLARASDAASALARLGRCIAVATSCWVLSSLNLLPKGCPRRLRCCPLSPGQCRVLFLPSPREGLRLERAIRSGITGAARLKQGARAPRAASRITRRKHTTPREHSIESYGRRCGSLVDSA